MKNLKEMKLMMERLESPRWTDTKYQERVKQLKEAPIRRDIGSFEDSVDAGKGTRWNVSHPKQGRRFYDLYTEKYGPFTVFTSDDNSVKIACLENGDCWDQTDRMVSREKAAQMLGVDSLDDIGYDR